MASETSIRGTTLCANCRKRKGTERWGDSLAMTHGLWEWLRAASLPQLEEDYTSLLNEIVDAPYVLLAMLSSLPSESDGWTEERLMLWLETFEKAARLVYGFRSDWMDHLGRAPDETPETRSQVVLSLTEKDLEGVPPEKIKALFEAVGKAMMSHSIDLPLPAPEDLTDAQVRGLGAVAVQEAERRGWVEPAQAKGQVDASDSSTSSEAPESEEAERDERQGVGRETPWQRYVPLRERIVTALEEAGRPLTRTELYAALGSGQGVPSLATRMVKEGLLRDGPDEGWGLPEPDTPPSDPEPEPTAPEPEEPPVATNGAGARNVSCKAPTCVLAALPGEPYCASHLRAFERYAALKGIPS